MALTAIFLKKAPDGQHADGGGLYFVKSGGSAKWIYRYSYGGKRPEMGLGSYPSVSLAEAREAHDKWARILRSGRNPKSVRDEEKALIAAQLAKRDPTLREVTEQVFEGYKARLKGDGKAGRWMSPLERHVFPKLGNTPVSAITPDDIHSVLRPIWKKKFPTAEKAIQRLGMIFESAEMRDLECSAITVKKARHMLGHVEHKTVPHRSTPWQDVPELFAYLEGRSAAASCLQFTLLTVVRVGASREARFDEIKGDIWTVPKERVKGRRGSVEDFRVPLSQAAIDLVERRREMGSEWVFTARRGRPLSDMAMSKLMKDQSLGGTPHGLRASFRTWVQENEATSNDVAETILSHTIGNKTERSYARSDLLDLRRPVMEAWAQYVTSKLPKSTPDK